MAQQDINKTKADNFKRLLFVKSNIGLIPIASGGASYNENPNIVVVDRSSYVRKFPYEEADVITSIKQGDAFILRRIWNFTPPFYEVRVNYLTGFISSEDAHLDFSHKIYSRIIEEHTPPTPTLKTSEIKVLNGTSIFHGTGVASYRIELKILFESKVKYAEFIIHVKDEFVYYDENGYIYQCVIIGDPTIERIEGGQRYIVKITLQGIKKNKHDDDFNIQFSDIDNSLYKTDIEELTMSGLISTITSSSNIYTYRPGNSLRRSEYAAFINRLRYYIKKAIQ